MKKNILGILILAFIALSCSSFITVEQEKEVISKYESYRYEVVEEIVIRKEVVLPKNSEVRITIDLTRGAFEDENIKVYAYLDDNSKGDPLLKQNRYLVLYLFADDFNVQEGKKKPVFNEQQFQTDLFKVLRVKE